jgi:hypothetical protein
LTRTKAWRLSLATILGFGWLFLVPLDANATCVNYIQSQTIAAAYEGDAEPTVHHMDTCSGDDIGYQIPIATSITFDGVEYSNVYATTNSVITFGSPDPTFWDYPATPSISLYSMDWFPGASGTSGLDIYYSEGGFQINLNMVPFGNYGAEQSTVNILVAITNTGGISVAYSYQGPEYSNMRTGVRLHDGSIVSLEAWGATQISAEEPLPTLQAEPVVDPTASPEPTPMTPEEQQEEVAAAAVLSEQISDLNNLIAAINGEEVEESTEEVNPEPEPSPEPTTEPDSPEPDVEVEPEIVTPEDPRFPDDDEQNEPDDPNPSPSPDTTNEESEETDPTPEPSEEPTPQPEDTDPVQEPEQNESVDEEVASPPSDNSTNNAISEEELNELNKLIGVNDDKLAAELSNTINNLSEESKEELAKDLGIKSQDIEIIAAAVKDNPVLAVAIVEFSNRAEENADAPMPYTLADATTEIAAEQFLSDPIGALTNIDFSKVLNPSEWGKDMTDDQREKAQEVIVPVIIASNIVAAAMTRRI